MTVDAVNNVERSKELERTAISVCSTQNSNNFLL